MYHLDVEHSHDPAHEVEDARLFSAFDPSHHGTAGSMSVEDQLTDIGVGKFHWQAAIICGIGNASDAVEMMAISYIIPAFAETSSPAEQAALAAAVFAGMIFGGMFCGVMSDRVGRKPLLIASLGINATFGFASATVSSWYWLVLMRIFSGVGVGGSIPSVFTLFAEYQPVNRRGAMLTAVAWFWMFGSIYTAGVAWLLMGQIGLSWRAFAVACAVPATVAMVLTILFLPESPRYYAVKGNQLGAYNSLHTIAQRCGKALRISSAAAVRIVQLGKGEPVWRLFGTGARRTTVLLSVVWFALSFGWYGLMIWIPTIFTRVNLQLDAYQDAFFVAAANLPGNILSFVLMDKLGRRRLLGWSMIISGGFAMLFAFSNRSWEVVVVSCALNAVSTAGWNALDCLSTESFPTTLRTSGMAVLASTGRLGSIAGQFVFSALIAESVFWLLVLAGIMLLVGSVASLLLPHEPANAELASSLDGPRATPAAVAEHVDTGALKQVHF